MVVASLRDLWPLVLLLTVGVTWRHNFNMRGLTYRSTIVPLRQERFWKCLLYAGLLGLTDTGLRRLGQLLRLGGPSQGVAALLRFLLVHAPFMLWAIRGPLSDRGSTRDDRGWSDSATRSWLWKWIAARIFGHTRIVLSEEWLQLNEAEKRRWTDRHYVIGMHPHGLLPLGAILNGLTWAGGGLRGITASGAVLPEPDNPGQGLHQRWFRHMRLRAAVASGACGLFPGFYEMFTKLGAFECTKPFIRDRLREDKDVAIFPGGAQESEYAIPGRYVACINKHKGFVRLALEERRDILPMWTFGDEAIMPQMSKTPEFIRTLQRILKEVTGLLVPPAMGGLPKFGPLTLVTGVPVSLEDLWPAVAGGEVSESAVNEGHRRYMEAQKKLFDSNKALVAGGHGGGNIEFL